MMCDWSKCSSLIILALTILFFSSCNQVHNDYKNLEEGVKFKIQAIGEKNMAASIGQYISFKLRIFNDRSEEIYKTSKKGIDKYEYFIYTHNKEGAIQRGLLEFQEGDSISFIMEPNRLQEQFPFVTLDSISKWYQVEFLFSLMEKKAERDNRLNALHNHAMLKEEVVIFDYLDRVGGRDKYKKWAGMYLHTKESGIKPKKDENLEISYKAYFLDDKLLDATSDSTKIKFRFGEKAQVIDGINRVISKLGAGGKADVIIPSSLAFGVQGSSSKLVPPSTPLRYELTIEKDTSAVEI